MGWVERKAEEMGSQLVHRGCSGDEVEVWRGPRQTRKKNCSESHQPACLLLVREEGGHEEGSGGAEEAGRMKRFWEGPPVGRPWQRVFGMSTLCVFWRLLLLPKAVPVIWGGPEAGRLLCPLLLAY